MIAFDTASAITDDVLQKAKADGIGVIFLYLKWATADLVSKIHSYGIAVGLIWETSAKRALGGQPAGLQDGHDAFMMANNLGNLPPNVALVFTIDFDAQPSQDAADLAYGEGFTLGCAPQPTIVYGNGASCALCKIKDCATYSFVAGGRGMRGTTDYIESGEADIIQDVGDQQHEALGINIDSDVLKDPAAPWAWHPDPSNHVIPTPQPVPIVTPSVPTTQALRNMVMQTALQQLGLYAGKIDGIWGPLSEAALQSFINNG